jgi:hypothetical protein
MYDIYLQALAVLEVLEWAERRIKKGRPVRVVSRLVRNGLFKEKAVVYLLDALRPNEALRFRNAVATIEGHYARLNLADKEWIRREGPVATGFYLSYLNDHTQVIDTAYQFLLGMPITTENDQVASVAGVLVMSPSWVVKVLMDEISPEKVPLAGAQVMNLFAVTLNSTVKMRIPDSLIERFNELTEMVRIRLNA